MGTIYLVVNSVFGLCYMWKLAKQDTNNITNEMRLINDLIGVEKTYDNKKKNHKNQDTTLLSLDTKWLLFHTHDANVKRLICAFPFILSVSINRHNSY